MTLWEWAVEVYQSEEAPSICLGLQDRHGQCTALLLWAIWGSPSAATLEKGAAIARGWDAEVIAPLRQARRNLRASRPPVDDRHREQLREEIMSAEMLAERLLLETLEALEPRNSGDPVQAAEAACAVWGSPAPREDLRKLAAAVA